jgi:L-serine dehydratase
MTYSAAPVGVFDLFTIGIGPSSSHTVGPMKAAAAFAENLRRTGTANRVATVRVEIFGSLAATGAGHGTFDAVLLGLDGARSDLIDSGEAARRMADIAGSGTVSLGAGLRVPCRTEDFVLRPRTVLPRHPNALTLTASDDAGGVVRSDTYYSTGGGFIVRDGDDDEGTAARSVPFAFRSAAELLAICADTGLPISAVMRANELTARPEAEVSRGLRALWQAMQASVTSAVSRTGVLPGGLKVRRRSGAWASRLDREDPQHDDRFWQERVNLVGLAVNEENASGGRIVTAPTNGAAGVIPAVLFYALNYTTAGRGAGDDARGDIVERFLLTAAAVGGLCKTNASISGAEVGCQGEVGTASSMAAAGLAEILGGTPRQVENAAEIALEHNLGLTCDPVGGLVQVPCIERNAIAATKAINAARMALWGDGEHHVSLDQAISTMRATGADMSHKYKETSLGGLAVNVVEC